MDEQSKDEIHRTQDVSFFVCQLPPCRPYDRSSKYSRNTIPAQPHIQLLRSLISRPNCSYQSCKSGCVMLPSEANASSQISLVAYMDCTIRSATRRWRLTIGEDVSRVSRDSTLDAAIFARASASSHDCRTTTHRSVRA